MLDDPNIGRFWRYIPCCTQRVYLFTWFAGNGNHIPMDYIHKSYFAKEAQPDIAPFAFHNIFQSTQSPVISSASSIQWQPIFDPQTASAPVSLLTIPLSDSPEFEDLSMQSQLDSIVNRIQRCFQLRCLGYNFEIREIENHNDRAKSTSSLAAH